MSRPRLDVSRSRDGVVYCRCSLVSAMTTPGGVMVTLPVLLMLVLASNALQLGRLDDAVNRKACPGCQWVCDDDETCCQMHSGDWGCCFMPNVSHRFSTHLYESFKTQRTNVQIRIKYTRKSHSQSSFACSL